MTTSSSVRPHSLTSRLRRWLIAGMLLTLAGLPQSRAAQTLDDLFPDPVIARGEGVLVRKGDLERAFTAYQANLASKGRQIPEVERTIREAQLLDRLIVTQLLVNHSNDEDRAKARELAANNLAASKEMTPTDAMFARRLKTLGLTIDQYNLQIMEFSIAQAVMERNLNPKAVVTEQQILDFYTDGSDILTARLAVRLGELAADPNSTGDQLKEVKDRIQMIRANNIGRFNKLERRRIRHLLLATIDRDTQQRLPEEEIEGKRRKIEQLLTIARGGEDFPKLIELYSEEQGAAETKGEATLVRKGRIPQLEAAAFSLVPNQLSDVVETLLGFHIVRLEEILPAQRISLEEARNTIRDLLTEQQIQTLMPGYFASLKDAAGITILSEAHKVVLPADSNPLAPSEFGAPSPADER